MAKLPSKRYIKSYLKLRKLGVSPNKADKFLKRNKIVKR